MTPDDTLSRTLELALEASAANDSEKALRMLRQAAEAAPGSAVPQFLLGAELAQIGRIEEAEAAYANAVLLQPDLHTARFELGTLQFTSGRAAMALLTWQPLEALPAGDPLRLFVQGYAALAQDRLAQALQAFAAGMRANQVNEALNANIRLLAGEIERVLAQGPAPAAGGLQDPAHAAASSPAGPHAHPSPQGAAPVPPEDAAAEAAETHFLLSQYGRQGPLH